jgi:hypothetical protein
MNRRGVVDILLAVGVLMLIVVVVATGQKVLAPLAKLSPSIQAEEVKLTLDAVIAAPGDIEYTYEVPRIANEKAIRFITFGGSGQVCVSSLSICELVQKVDWELVKIVFLAALYVVVDFVGDLGGVVINLGSAIVGLFAGIFEGDVAEGFNTLVSEGLEALECAAAAFGLGDCESETDDLEDEIADKIRQAEAQLERVLDQLYCQNSVLDPGTSIRTIDAARWAGLNWEALWAACDVRDLTEVASIVKAAVTGPANIVSGVLVALEVREIESDSFLYNEPDSLIFKKIGNNIKIEER